MRLALSSLVLLLGTAACKVPNQHEYNHWRTNSLVPRIGYSMTGFDSQDESSYREFAWQQKQDINLTLRRHLLNDNPYNPFQHDRPYMPPERPPHSPLPDAVTYFHVSALVYGAIFMAGGGSFVPVPVDSILAHFEEGGGEELAEGFAMTFTGAQPEGQGPTHPSNFRVKNR